MKFYLSDFRDEIQTKIYKLMNGNSVRFNDKDVEEVANYLGRVGVNYKKDGNIIKVKEDRN